MVVGKNFPLANSSTGLTDGNDQTVQDASTGQYIKIPVTQRAMTGSPNTLSCTTVANSTSVAAQVLTVYTTALVQAGDVITLSLFVQPSDYEDNYNMRQLVTGFQTQIGFTRANEPETGAGLVAALLVTFLCQVLLIAHDHLVQDNTIL